MLTVLAAATYTVNALLGLELARNITAVDVRDVPGCTTPGIKQLLVTFTPPAVREAGQELDVLCNFEGQYNDLFAQYVTPDGACWQLGDGDDSGAVELLGDGCTFALWLRACGELDESYTAVACTAFA
jgi:hypothetical protein